MTEVSAPVLSSEHEDLYAFDKFQTRLNERTYLGPGVQQQTLNDRIRDYYSVDKLIEFLKIRVKEGIPRYRSITLQFSDDLVTDSAIIVQMLQEGLAAPDANEIDFTNVIGTKHHHHEKGSCTDDIEVIKKPCSDKKNGACTCDDKNKDVTSDQQKIWILADTSYSPCCVDEVAAEHVKADIVIHFGDACLNPIEKLPAVYVFGKSYLDHDAIVAAFRETYTDNEAKICLMSDAPFSYHLSQLYKLLKMVYPNLVYADIANTNKSLIIDHVLTNTEQSYETSNRIIFGLDTDDVQGDDDVEVTQQYELFHINLPPPPRLLELSTKFSTITSYDTATNTTSQGPYPSLMKRYRFMHIARTAGTIGILVNTLSLSNTKHLLNKVAQWIKDAGKKHYMFVVGKPNVAKLANFESIDIWCVLGCGQSGIIIDNVGDYYKPIITPYELQMALSDELTWTGKWIVDFKQVLSLEKLHDEEEEEVDAAEKDIKTDDDDDAPEFDPVTGKYVTTSRPLRRYVPHLEIEEEEHDPVTMTNDDKSLVKRFSSAITIKGTVSTSAVSLQNRQWTGLGSDFHARDGDEDEDEEGAVVEEGRGGVARGYDFDRANNNI